MTPQDKPLVGTVIFFDNTKGYGSVRPDGTSDRHFFDYNDIVMPGRLRTLQRGQTVTFRTEKVRDKVRAVEVRPKS